jgi:formate/nitrite transporter
VGFALLVHVGNTLAGSKAAGNVAALKTSLPVAEAFVRGIMCNWLVCMAVYLASFSKDAVGKLVPIWFCISSFIALGLEHSVANMFVVPFGILSGSTATWPAFLIWNLVPVTLGNIVGGAVCVALPFAKAYGKRSKIS